jgi:hypothetical protein
MALNIYQIHSRSGFTRTRLYHYYEISTYLTFLAHYSFEILYTF